MIKAIETRYAGCHFRSRLEARWAVFFDALKIEWQYEPQGFELNRKLTLLPGKIKYLPDFWLPDLACYGEVKGDLTLSEHIRFLDCAAALGAEGTPVAVFGPVNESQNPWVLPWNSGDLLRFPLFVDEDQSGAWSLMPAVEASDYGNSWAEITSGREGWYSDSRGSPPQEDAIRELLRGCDWPTPTLQVILTAARSARFEHGESG